MTPKITIAIPAHNNETVIAEAIRSAVNQDYPNKEILVIDDASTDSTALVARSFPDVRLIINDKNLGIGFNLVKCMEEAQGKYVLYLCGDDIFADNHVASDVCKVFDNKSDIGVIGRYCYYFMHGHPGAIGVNRDKNILISSCCPSGMAFRKMAVLGTNKIFIEMPFIVSQYLKLWRWTMFEYDTVACRFLPGVNTGTKENYFKESPTQNWVDLVGPWFKNYEIFIMLKNRAPKILWREIWLVLKLEKASLGEVKFWLYAITAVIVPTIILRRLTNFYRHRIARRSAKIIKRGEHE